MIKADARYLLGQCADLAKGARFYADNYQCDEFKNDDGQRIFLSACMGVLAFCLDVIDEHYSALDEAGQYRKGEADCEFRLDYSKRYAK